MKRLVSKRFSFNSAKGLSLVAKAIALFGFLGFSFSWILSNGHGII